MASKIKKGDLVQVITGAKAERGGDRGKQGKKPTRVGFRTETVERNGKQREVRIRVAKSSGKDI